MSDVASEFRRVQTAYTQPTLTLISRPTSPAVLTVFRIMFTAEKPTVPTARMHDQVEELLADLRRSDLPHVPSTNGRDSCLKWMRDGWLLRLPDDDGNEVYQLTSSALDGLRTVERLTKDRSISLSSHLIAGLVRHLRDFASTLAPDAGEYITNLQLEKDRIQTEINRVLDGGEIEEATDDDIVQGVAELQRYLTELPSDFTRVVESYREFEHDTIANFRTASVTSGDAVRLYLEHVRELGTSSAAGRGFEGALQLLRDPDLLDQVNRYISTLLDTPRATDLLIPEERAQVRNTVTLIREGLKRVLEQRAKVSRTLHDYITSHDVERDHELAATLRALEVEMRQWMQEAGPRAKAPLPLLPGTPDITHLRTKMYDPANDEPPPPMADPEMPAGVGGLSLAELRARGGPSHASLREQLSDKLAAATGVGSLAGLFHSLPDALRRPVEILGVLPLARRHGLEPTGDAEVYEALRADGSRRRFQVPHYARRTRALEQEPAGTPDSATGHLDGTHPETTPHDPTPHDPMQTPAQETHG
jgi:hypothetical protein